MLNATDEYLNRLMGHKGSPYARVSTTGKSLDTQLEALSGWRCRP